MSSFDKGRRNERYSERGNSRRNDRGGYERRNPPVNEEQEDEVSRLIEGKNAVVEAIRAGTPLDKIYISCAIEGPVTFIVSAGKAAGAVVVETDKRKLDGMTRTGNHQGVIAIAAAKEYCDVADIIALAHERGEEPFIIICDGITDDHNLGAIIRTAEGLGAHGVIIPRRRSASVTPTVSRTSAGAVEHMLIARVSNLTAAIRELKDSGVWIYGTAADGSSTLWQTDLTGAVAIVVGSEGEGMSRLVAEQCDFVMSIPMSGKVNSLNASVSAGIVIYETAKQRRAKASPEV